MKRTPLKRRTRLRRVSKKTRTVRWPRLKALRERLFRWQTGCQAIGLGDCRGPHDAHHIIKRSQGGQDRLDNLIRLCRHHHNMTDWPYAKGRLLVDRVGPWLHLRRATEPDTWIGRLQP